MSGIYRFAPRMARFAALIALFAGTPGALAAPPSPTPAPQSDELTLRQISGEARGLFYGLRWPTAGRGCEAARSARGEEPVWQAVKPRACEAVRAFIQGHRRELESADLTGREREFETPPGSTVGVLTHGKRKFAAELMTAPTCDVTLTKCTAPKLTPASELGVRLRDAITRELGR